jgi:hypothetical protein
MRLKIDVMERVKKFEIWKGREHGRSVVGANRVLRICECELCSTRMDVDVRLLARPNPNDSFLGV